MKNARLPARVRMTAVLRRMHCKRNRLNRRVDDIRERWERKKGYTHVDAKALYELLKKMQQTEQWEAKEGTELQSGVVLFVSVS